MKNILITGGSEGIGLALAKAYANSDTHLYLVARNIEKLQVVQNALSSICPVDIFSCDLTVEKEVETLLENLNSIQMDIVVLNAGVGYAGGALSLSDAQDRNVIRLNVESVVMLGKYYARQMRDRNHGLLIFMSSTGAFQPGPYIATYYASKSFIYSYARALAYELRSTGVHVCIVLPGPVDTAFYQKSGGVMSKCHTTPEKVASIVVKKAEKKTILVIGLGNQILRIFPAGLKMKVVGRLKQVSKED